MDPLYEKQIGRHIKQELENPGTFAEVDSPYARCIEKLANIVRSRPDPNSDDKDDDDPDLGPSIDL